MSVQEILEAARQKGGDRFFCKATLHITADGRAVGEDDPAGRFVLKPAGGSLPLSLAQRLGLAAPEPEPLSVEVSALETVTLGASVSVTVNLADVNVSSEADTQNTQNSPEESPEGAEPQGEEPEAMKTEPEAVSLQAEPELEPEEKAVKSARNKAVKPQANKAVKPAENKGEGDGLS